MTTRTDYETEARIALAAYRMSTEMTYTLHNRWWAHSSRENTTRYYAWRKAMMRSWCAYATARLLQCKPVSEEEILDYHLDLEITRLNPGKPTLPRLMRAGR